MRCPLATSCIKLVKPWKDEEESEESEGEADGPPLGRQVAELTIDRQIIRELVAAGGCLCCILQHGNWWCKSQACRVPS